MSVIIGEKKYTVDALRTMKLPELKALVYQSTCYQFSSISIALDAGISVARFFRNYNEKRSYTKRKALVEQWYGESAPHEIGSPQPIEDIA